MTRRSPERAQADPQDIAKHPRHGTADQRLWHPPAGEVAILDEVVDAAEAATMLGVTRQHVVLLLQRGRLPGKRLTATWITTRKAVEDYARHRRPPGRPSRSDTPKT